MEIKDLAMTVELGTEMADVRGGSHRRFNVGNVRVSQLASTNQSQINNGSVFANTRVNGNRSFGSSFSDIGGVVEYAPTNTVTQTSGIALDITSMFDGLNFS